MSKRPTPKKKPPSSFTDEDSFLIPAYFEHAKIPKLYWGAQVTKTHSPACWKFAQNIEQNLKNGAGLLLMGPNGTGKTFLACGLLKKALPITRKVMYVTAPELIQAIIHSTPFDDEMTIYDAAVNRELLVIDDLAQEYRGSGSGFSELQFGNLLRTRVTQKRSTIFTTNATVDAIEQIYGAGFRSLLAEGCIEILLNGPDRRQDRQRRKQLAKDAGVLNDETT